MMKNLIWLKSLRVMCNNKTKLKSLSSNSSKIARKALWIIWSSKCLRFNSDLLVVVPAILWIWCKNTKNFCSKNFNNNSQQQHLLLWIKIIVVNKMRIKMLLIIISNNNRVWIMIIYRWWEIYSNRWICMEIMVGNNNLIMEIIIVI